MTAHSVDDIATSDITAKINHQLRGWRESLIDLTRGQRLIYFRHLKVGTVEIRVESFDSIWRLLGTGAQQLLPGKSEDGNPLPFNPSEGLFCPNSTAKAVQSAGGALISKARDVSTGQGVWPLHLGLGMLHWTDPDTRESAESPVLMVPVEVIREGVGRPWKVALRDEEAQFNPALRLRLRDFDITLPGDDEVDSPMEFLTALSASIDPGWEIKSRAVLANFSFPKLAMYNDLRDNADYIGEHPLVQMLAVGPDAPRSREFPFEARPLPSLDTYRSFGSSMSILDADSSQRQCVAAALDGKSFVMDGPPGTGKSQTIANIVAELVAVGKSVLFVSEKAAALEVVESRLSAAGLGHLILNLHGERTRKEVARHLGETLALEGNAPRTGMSAAQVDALSTSVEELTHFAQAMNERRAPLELSLIVAIGEVDRRLNGLAIPSLTAPVDVRSFDDRALARLEEVATQYAQANADFTTLAEPVWIGLERTQHSRAEVNHAAHNAGLAAETLSAVVAAAAKLDEDFDLDPATSVLELERRVELGALIRENRQVPFEWFADEIDVVSSRVDELVALSADRQDKTAKLDTNIGTGWHSADAATLSDALDSALSNAGAREWTSPAASASAAALDAAGRSWDEMRAALPILADAFTFAESELSANVIDQLVALSSMADRPARPPMSWFNPTRLPAIGDSLRSLSAAREHAERSRQRAGQHFLDSILSEDITSLIARFQAHGGSIWTKVGRTDKKVLRGHSRSGKAPKELIAQLATAAEWKHAAARLDAEAQRAESILGFSPDLDDTAIASYLQAWELAKDSVETAGLSVPLAAVAAQLASDGSSTPTLIPAARSVAEHSRAARAALSHVGLEPELTELALMPLQDAQNQAHAWSSSLRLLAEVLDEVQSTLGLQVADVLDSSIATSLLEQIRSIRTIEAEILTRVGELGLNGSSDFDAFEFAEDLAWVRSVQSSLGRPLSRTDYQALYRTSRMPTDTADTMRSYRACIENLLAMFDDGRRAELESELTGTPEQCVELLEQAASEAAHVIPLVDQLHGSRDVLTSAGLAPVVDFCLGRRMDATSTTDALIGALLDSWVDQITLTDARLIKWRATERNQMVAHFASLDQQLVESAHSRILRAYKNRTRKIGQTPGVQVITREAEKKTRHLPIRTLLDRAADTVQIVKPCMMMSPLTVSHYVPADMVFDVVVFDEASQVRPEDAVNCIYRGRQLVVAGDQKQLPPTAFFASGDDDGDADSELDDFESVLDLAKAASLTALPLTWHYRSRHESLIAFSNRRFYEGKLFTFPSATFEAPDLGVSFVRADGFYRRGTTRDNPIEAATVAERVRFFAEVYPDLSIGVVTMSEAQRTAVQDAMERLADKSPAVAALLNSGAGIDDFFVKALENVQGDERDVIIMSIGYGPDEHGKFTMNFGPLNKKGGWRRLNVAITRARRRLEVAASFDHGMLIPGNNETLMHLRHFLNYAQNGPNVLAHESEDSLGGAESVFEEQVLAQIESWGYDVVTQVGVAGYRIDMAVRHPQRPGTYAIGIECDGAAYHSAPTARDRDRLRHAVLEGLGWRLHRIWGLSWWRDRETQISVLRSAIEGAIADTHPVLELPATSAGGSAALDVQEMDFGPADSHPSVTAPVRSTVDEPTESLPDWVRPYDLIELDASSPVADGVPSLNGELIVALISEAPVSEARLLTLYKASTGAARVSPSTKEWLLAELERDPRFTQDARSFWHATGRPVEFFRQPPSGNGRSPVLEISDAELQFAILRLVEANLLLEQEQLIEQIVHLAGDSYVTRPARRVVENALEHLRLSGQIFVDDDGYVHWP